MYKRQAKLWIPPVPEILLWEAFYIRFVNPFPSGSSLSSTKGIPGLGGLSIELQYEIPSHLSDLSDTDIWKKTIQL